MVFEFIINHDWEVYTWHRVRILPGYSNGNDIGRNHLHNAPLVKKTLKLYLSPGVAALFGAVAYTGYNGTFRIMDQRRKLL